MKLSVNEAYLTGLCARNCASYSTGVDFKICLRDRNVCGPFEKQAPAASFFLLCDIKK